MRFPFSAIVGQDEMKLALTGLILVALSWNAPNQTGALCFALLYVMRLSAKLNIFFGVPNAASEIMPPHLAYLRSYYGPERLNAALVLSLALAVALAAWIASIALASTPGSPQAVQTSLLFTLAALGVLEHVFLALPFRDGILWGWALPSRRNRESHRTTPFDLTGEADHGL
jgi:putative photosynthetic complex assembly protein 2